MEKTSLLTCCLVVLAWAFPAHADTVINLASPVAVAGKVTVTSPRIILTGTNETYLVSGTTTAYGIRCDASCTVVLSNASITVATAAPLDLNGQTCTVRTVTGSTSTLKATSTLITSTASLQVNDPASLTLEGEGTLTIPGYANNCGAGIGSSFGVKAGTITVNGGTVTVYGGNNGGTSGANGAVIGGGGRAAAGTIIINGGTVTATSYHWAPAIGCGANLDGATAISNFGTYIQNGGTVIAIGGFDGGAAIGGGHASAAGGSGGGVIKVLGGTLYAQAGDPSAGASQPVAVLGSGNYAAGTVRGTGAAVTIDVSADVYLYINSNTRAGNVPMGSSVAAADQGTLTISNMKGLASPRHFLTATGRDVFNTTGLAVSYSNGLAAAQCCTRTGGCNGTAYRNVVAETCFTPDGSPIATLSYAIPMTGSADFSTPSASSTAFTLTNDIGYVLTGWSAGNTTSGASVTLATNATIRIQAGTMAFTGTASPINVNGHRLDLVLDASSTNTFTGSTAAIRVDKPGTLVVTGTGAISAIGAAGAAAIGSVQGSDAGTIIISNGTVNATSTHGGSGLCGAGIGAGALGNGGTVEIDGASTVVNATGGDWGPGIGAGGIYESSTTTRDIGTIVINDGTIVARGGMDGGAGIGGGHGNDKVYRGVGGGSVTINGGNVTAIAGRPVNGTPYVAAIGGGNFGGHGSAVTIDVSATVALDANEISLDASFNVDIGSAYSADSRNTGLRKGISSGTLAFTNKKGIAGPRGFLTTTATNILRLAALPVTYDDTLATNTHSIVNMGGEIAADYWYRTATVTIDASAPDSASPYYSVSGGVIYLTNNAASYFLTGSTTSTRFVSLVDADVIFSGLTVKSSTGAPFDCGTNAVHVTLATGTANKLEMTGSSVRAAGLQVNVPASVVIEGGGALNAIGNYGGAGIGSARGKNAGAILIGGGAITAQGANGAGSGVSGAGIGSGYAGSTTYITITNGTVNAFANEWGAGIGRGSDYGNSTVTTNGTILITGGTVTATGGSNGGAAIGLGHGTGSDSRLACSAGTIKILGGTVTATAGTGSLGEPWAAAIGGGNYGGEGAAVTIDVSATVIADANRANASGYGLTYPNVDIGSASSPTKGSITFSNLSGLTGSRVFLTTTATNILVDTAGPALAYTNDLTAASFVATRGPAGYDYTFAGAVAARWTGGSAASSGWSDADNWSGTLGAVNDTVTFTGSARLTNTFDLASSCAISNLLFDTAAGAFRITGSTGPTITGQLVNGSPNVQTLAAAASFANGVTLDAVSPVVLGPGPTFAGAATKTGASRLTFTDAVGLPSAFAFTEGALGFSSATSAVASTITIASGTTFGVAGTNVLSGATLALPTSMNFTRLDADADGYLAVKAISFPSWTSGSVASGVTVRVENGCNMPSGGSLGNTVTWTINGTLDTGKGALAFAENSKFFAGAGTIRAYRLNAVSSSWMYFTVSNVVCTGPVLCGGSIGEFRMNAPVRIGTVTDWTSSRTGTTDGDKGTIFRLYSGPLTFDTLDEDDKTTAHRCVLDVDLVASSGGVRKVNPGTLVYANSYTYTGATTVEGGTLELTNGASIASSALTVASDATLRLDGGTNTCAAATLKGTLVLGTTNSVLAVTGAADVAGMRIAIPDNLTLDPKGQYVILTAASIANESTVTGPLKNWHTYVVDQNGTKTLVLRSNDLFYLRIVDTSGLSVSNAWVSAKFPALASAVDAAISNTLANAGANGVTVWESYVLGLDPTNAASRVLCSAAQDADAASITLNALNVASSVPADCGATVQYVLQHSTDRGSWTDYSTNTEPSATIALAELSPGFFRFRTDILLN